VCVCAGRLARVGSKSKEELAKSLAQSSASGTIPAKGPGRHPRPNTINIYILISIDIHIYINTSINNITINKIQLLGCIFCLLLQTAHQDVLYLKVEQDVPLLWCKC
jgi:hypothetical protein